MSPAVERRIAAIVPEHCLDPFGNPVPGLADLGVNPCHMGAARGVALPELPDGEARLRRIGEPAQIEIETVRWLWEIGLVPGALFGVQRDPHGVAVQIGQDRAIIPDEVARHLFAEVAPGAQHPDGPREEGHRSQS